jgi:hypothetical protein
VDWVGYEIGDLAQNPLVPLEARQAGERIRHNGQGKVPPAPCGTGMTGMRSAVVANVEPLRG